MRTVPCFASPSEPASAKDAPTPGAAGASPVPASGATPLRWDSRQLLGDAQQVEIHHGDTLYRLRLTALGKLILTK